MKCTSAQAAKLLEKLKQDYSRIAINEKNSKTFLASINENVESVRPEYDYEKTKVILSDLQMKIRKIKHAINMFNTQTIIPDFNMTIDEMLIYLPQLSMQKEKLIGMVNVLPKERHYTNSTSNIIDYKYINYDLNKVKEDLDSVTQKLANAQLALDAINHESIIEIDI